MDEQMALNLTRLMNCLVSNEAKQDLYGRLDDEDSVYFMNGLTEEQAEIGMEWWKNNSDYLSSAIKDFRESIELTAQELNLDVSVLLKRFVNSSWSDFIRESFYFAIELLDGEKDLSDFDDFMKYAVKMSIEYSMLPDLEDLTPKMWDNFTLVFEEWWKNEIPQELFLRVFHDTQSGQKLIND